jgi:hypothetical protein
MKQIVAIIYVFLLSTISFLSKAQTEKPEIVTDRPDQTESPSLVPQGGLQVELGASVENDKSHEVKYTNVTYSTALIKYGINENFELRLITEYLGERAKALEGKEQQVKGLSPLALGLKIKLADEKGVIPQTSLIGHVNLKSGSSEFSPEYTAVDFRFTFAHTLSEKLALSYNLGAEWNGQTPDATFLYTLSLGYVVTKRIGAFVESYSFFPEDSKADHRLDAGVTYKFTPVIQADVSGGIGISENAPDSFVSAGISFRCFR